MQRCHLKLAPAIMFANSMRRLDPSSSTTAAVHCSSCSHCTWVIRWVAAQARLAHLKCFCHMCPTKTTPCMHYQCNVLLCHYHRTPQVIHVRASTTVLNSCHNAECIMWRFMSSTCIAWTGTEDYVKFTSLTCTATLLLV